MQQFLCLESQCRLLQCQQIHQLSYKALSYCWGKKQTKHLLQISKRDVTVCSNLFEALTELLRSRFWGRFCVDALGINQDDEEEKKRQLKNMSGIYYQARRVIIWFGQPSNHFDQALLFLSWFVRQVHDQTSVGIRLLALLESEVWTSPAGIYGHPWFSRVWTLKEVVLARDSTMLFAGREVGNFYDLLALASSTFVRPPRNATKKNSVEWPD